MLQSNPLSGSNSTTNEVQEKAAYTNLMIIIATYIPSFLTNLVISPLSDKYGRKPVIIISGGSRIRKRAGGTIFMTLVVAENILVPFSVNNIKKYVQKGGRGEQLPPLPPLDPPLIMVLIGEFLAVVHVLSIIVTYLVLDISL